MWTDVHCPGTDLDSVLGWRWLRRLPPARCCAGCLTGRGRAVTGRPANQRAPPGVTVLAVAGPCRVRGDRSALLCARACNCVRDVSPDNIVTYKTRRLTENGKGFIGDNGESNKFGFRT